MSSTALYLILKLDTIQALIVGGALISFLALVFIALFAVLAFDYVKDAIQYLKENKKIIAAIVMFCIISALTAAFMPTTKDMLIIKGYESLKNTGVTLENVVEKVNNATDAWVKSLSSK